MRGNQASGDGPTMATVVRIGGDILPPLRTVEHGASPELAWSWFPSTGSREALRMPKFVTIGYGDRDGYERTDPAVRNEAHERDVQLQSEGFDMGVAGMPVQVRNHDAAGVQTESGGFMRSQLPVAGFAVIEAANMAEAVDMVSNTPCAVAHGVVEVWPLDPRL